MRSRSLLWSFNHAIEGIVHTIRTQRNMRLHLIAAAIVLVMAMSLDIDRQGLIALVFAIGLVWVTELVNTAVEAAIDVATEQFDPAAKVAKDVAAGAVLVAATVAVVIGYLVLFDPLARAASVGLDLVELSGPDITVTALGFTLIAVLVAKALAREKNFLHGGWPSGHAALAFGAATLLSLSTRNPSVLVVSFFIAFLVAQSRVEGEIHSVPQVIIGSLLGILVVTSVWQVAATLHLFGGVGT